jgi:hypothetical protein
MDIPLLTMTMPMTLETTATAAGKIKFNEFQIKKTTDKASPR